MIEAFADCNEKAFILTKATTFKHPDRYRNHDNICIGEDRNDKHKCTIATRKTTVLVELIVTEM